MLPVVALRAVLPASKQVVDIKVIAEGALMNVKPVPCIQPRAQIVAKKRRSPFSPEMIAPYIVKIATSLGPIPRIMRDSAGNADGLS
jgi:hypothetical protein